MSMARSSSRSGRKSSEDSSSCGYLNFALFDNVQIVFEDYQTECLHVPLQTFHGMVPGAFLHLIYVFLGELLPFVHVPEEYHSFTYALRRLQAYVAFKHKYAYQGKNEEGLLLIEAFLQPLEVVRGQGAYKEVYAIFKQ